MKLYCEGYSISKGWAISKTWSNEECRKLPVATACEMAPVKFIDSREHALAFVSRWNRRFATH